ncbi:hypothetical protein KAI46_00685 [bacterium]|nr:hypothetical protein [bacterium]
MKIYLADVPIRTIFLYISKKPEALLNLLVAFGSDALEDFLNYQHLNIAKFFSSVFLDSGTYSLNSGKKDPHRNRWITVENFIDFIKRFGHLFDFYPNFDEGFEPEDMMKNLFHLNRMEKAGLNPLPVVHDLYGDEIDIFIDRGYKHVCLGSALVNNKKTMELLMKRFEGTGIKRHIFGQISFDQITENPISGCDSTGWARKVSKGNVCWWNPEKEGLNKTETFYIPNKGGNSKETTIFNHPCKTLFDQFLQDEFNVNLAAFTSTDKSTILQQMVNIHYFITMEKAVNKIQREKGFSSAE